MKKLLICLLWLGAFDAAHAAEPRAKAKTAANKAAATTPTADQAAATPSAAVGGSDERAKRRADIDYWLKGYDGSEFTSGDYRCPPPRIPAVSKDNQEIDRVAANMESWQECHNKAVKHFNATPSFGKLMPADVAALLTPEEMKQATERLQLVHDNVNETLKVSAELVLADFSAWRSATNAWVNEHNDIVKNAPTPEREHQLDERRQNRVN